MTTSLFEDVGQAAQLARYAWWALVAAIALVAAVIGAAACWALARRIRDQGQAIGAAAALGIIWGALLVILTMYALVPDTP